MVDRIFAGAGEGASSGGVGGLELLHLRLADLEDQLGRGGRGA